MGKNKKKKKSAVTPAAAKPAAKPSEKPEKEADSTLSLEKKSEKMPESSKKLLNANKNAESNTKLFLFLAFFIPFLIMGVMFARADIFPFGDRQMMYSDCKQQYLPFLKEYQNKLQSGESMLYSWRNGLGTNFISMIAYYIASPLNLITLVVPAEYVREAMTVFVMIKIGCASLFTAIFLKHVYKRNDLSLVAFGCCYAFCDFIMGYYWDTIWLDSVALLPLVALGVYCVINENKFKLYIVSLALAFASSYYIGYMICLFVVLWFIVQCVISRLNIGQFCKKLMNMALYSIIALAATLPLVLPTVIQLSNTAASNEDFPKKAELYNNFMKLLSNLLSFHEPTTMDGLPNIGVGVVCILLIAIYIRAKEISLREKIASICLLLFMFISLNVNTLDFIWHGMHFPNQIPYRFAFIFCFVLIAIAYRGFSVFVKLDKRDIIGMCIATILMVCVSVFYLDKKAIIGSLIIAAFYILFMSLFEMNLLNRRALTVFVSLLVIVEMCIEANIGVNTVGTTGHDNYPADEEEVQEMLDYAYNLDSTDFYRIDQTEYSTKNDGMIYGYDGIGQFSSTSYKSIITFMGRFGLVAKRSSFQYLLTSPVTSMFLNVKYVVSRDSYTANDTSLTKVAQAEGSSVSLYENEYYLPIGYMSDDNIQSVDMENDSVFITQNKVFSAATGIDKNVYTLLNPSRFDCTNISHSSSGKGMYSYNLIDESAPGIISVTYEAPKDGMIYAWANVKSADTVSVESSHINHSYFTEAQRYIFPVGYYKKGETVTLRVDAGKSGKNIIGAAYLNTDVLDEGYAILSDEGLKVNDYSSTKIEGTITVKDDGTFLTSIPYEKGWTLYVDGEKTETIEVMEAFLAADLTKGTHEIKLVYSPEGFVPGVVMFVLAVAGFIVLCVLDARKKKNIQNVK